ATMQQIAWDRIDVSAVAELVWEWGASTDALSRRLNALALEPSAAVEEVLTWTTQKLLRRHWKGSKVGDPITSRMTQAGERRCSSWRQEARLERLAEGAVGEGRLAWMLGVPETSLEVDEPEEASELADDDLAALLGCRAVTGAPLMFFHDTSVLVNFHRPGLIPVLVRLLLENVRWTATFRAECQRKEQELGLPGLVDAAEELLGDPLYANEEEHAAIRHLRRQMSAPGDHPQQHLGEAESLTIIQKRRLRAVFVTDDRAAVGWAAPIECVGTWKLLR